MPEFSLVNLHELCANCRSIEHVNLQEYSCTGSSKCQNSLGDHPEKEVQEIQVTLAVTFPEARHTAEGLDKRTYANVSKISQQQSQPSNN